MKSKFKIVLSFVLALMLAVQAPLVALATTKSSSPFISGTYTHQTKFDKFKRYDGVDVSSYQEDINWKKAKADGVDFAMIRVGCRGYANSGTFIDDKYFVQNITNAKKAGVKVGAYFYSQAISVADAKKEANHVLNLISKYEFDLPIAYDIEYAEKNGKFVGRLYNAHLSKSEQTKIALTFCDMIEKAGFQPMVYASKSFLEDKMNYSTLKEEGIDIWLAHYVSNTGYKGDYSMWQYTSKGKVAGIPGKVDCNFIYVDPNEKDFTVSDVGSHSYTGKEIEPEMSVYYKTKKLKESRDYTIKYSDNTEIGKAKITVTGINNYALFNTLTEHFEIVPKKAAKPTAQSATVNSIKLTWDKSNNISGYNLQYYSNGWKNAYTGASNTYTLKKLLGGTDYKFRVRTYKNVSGKTYYGSFSSQMSASTAAGKVTGLKASSTTPNSVQLSWAKQNADYYRIYIYSAKTKKYTKYADVKSNSATVSKLASNTTYYFKVRAYKTIPNGSITVGDCSSSIKTYTRPNTIKATTAKSKAKKKITAYWKKAPGISGYQVMWSTSKNFSSNVKSVYVKGAGSAKTTIKTAQSKKKYYVRVRAYKERGNAKVYSYWSNTLFAKVK